MRAAIASIALLCGVVVVSLVVGCSGGIGTAGTVTSDGGPESTPNGPNVMDDASDGGPPSSGGASTNGALKIISLTTTAPTITGGQRLATEPNAASVLAIVTDAKGLDNIAGGTVVDTTGATYGSFGTGSTKGAYSATLEWDAINQVRSLDFAAGAGERKLVARFFDNDGNVAEAPFTLGLQCRVSANVLTGACGGACADTMTAGENCGVCGTRCDSGKTCSAGACKSFTNTGGGFSSCSASASVVPETTCNDVCTALGLPCDTGISNTEPGCPGPSDSSRFSCYDAIPRNPNSPKYFLCFCH